MRQPLIREPLSYPCISKSFMFFVNFIRTLPKRKVNQCAHLLFTLAQWLAKTYNLQEGTSAYE